MAQKKKQINSYNDFINLKSNQLLDPHTQELEISYKDAIKGLRFLRSDFDYDLRKPVHPNTKRKVKKAMQEYISLITQPAVKIVVPRKKNRKKLLKHTNQSNKWKKAIVPIATGDEKIVYKGNQTVLVGKYGEEFNIMFDKARLLTNMEGEIDRILKGMKKGRDFDCIYIICGDNHLLNKDELENFAGSIKALKRIINRLMDSYAAADQNNYFMNWLEGLKFIKLRNQDLDCSNWSNVYEQRRLKNKEKTKFKKNKKKDSNG